MLYFVLLQQDMDFGFEKFWVVSMFIAEKTSDLTGSMVCGMNWSHQSSVDNCNLFLRLQYVINDRQNMDASENIMIIALVFKFLQYWSFLWILQDKIVWSYVGSKWLIICLCLVAYLLQYFWAIYYQNETYLIKFWSPTCA